jgi:hypothetical protein
LRALSRHLGLRFPEFTSRSLAELVQAHSDARPAHANPGPTLFSLTGTVTVAGTLSLRPCATGRAAGTHRVTTRARRRWRTGVLALVLIAASLGALIVRHEPAPRAAPIEASTPPPTPPVAPAPAASAPAPAPIPPPSNKPAKRHAAPRAHAPASEPGYLTVNAEPWGVVFVDGHRFAAETPVYRAPIAAGPHRVAVWSPARRAYSPTRKLTVAPGKDHVVGFDW